MQIEQRSGGLRLELSQVHVRYGGTVALDSVSLRLGGGEILAVIGANGAGKSTLVRSIAGLQPLRGGSIRLNGKDVSRMQFVDRCRSGVALTFQIPRSAMELSVAEQLVAQTRGIGHVRSRRARTRLAEVRDVVDRLALGAQVRRRVRELTLGEIRRFELARALLNRPKVLLVDEPSSGMSADEAVVLASALKQVGDEGIGVILVEHNIPFVLALCDRAVVLDAGRVLTSGPTAEVFASNEVREAYLGSAAAAR